MLARPLPLMTVEPSGEAIALADDLMRRYHEEALSRARTHLYEALHGKGPHPVGTLVQTCRVLMTIGE